ncbi:hypothetical protein OG432_34050 [Streptomyces sp. NBC_00442]|uniref:hypothetical protein n=1 Tax=Streptomyces sp. NBC_00442 TaxID=2903651 RepID=UPI002E24071E
MPCALVAAFASEEEADLVDALRADARAPIDGLSVVSTDEDGRPVGHALLTRCHVGSVPALCLTRATVHGIGLNIDVPDDAVMALALDAGHALPRGTVHYAAPFGI